MSDVKSLLPNQREQLIISLTILKEGDEEINHKLADELLLGYINDEEITQAFNSIKKWYA